MITEVSSWTILQAALLFFGGLACLVVDVRSRQASASTLPPWNARVVEMAILVWMAVSVGILLQLAIIWIGRAIGIGEDWLLATASFGLQGGILVSLLLALRQVEVGRLLLLSPRRLRPESAAIRGAFYFLGAIPLLWMTSLFWQGALYITGLFVPMPETPPQELVEFFASESFSAKVLAFAFLGVVMAPLVEEILFRGVIFRFLASRSSMALASTVSGLLFALVHFNTLSFLPLFLLGILLARAYNQTGCIGVPIAMHAWFNFSMIGMLITSGGPVE